MVATTMFGVVLTGHGGPECLQWRDDLPVPEPGPQEVLIQVGAAGVNNTDINTRIGWYSKGEADAADASWSGQALSFPRIQGIDACGTIVAVGAGVDSSRIGQRVLVEPCITEIGGRPLERAWFFGSECDGGFAEYTTVASVHAHRIESPLSDIELASFPCSYSTAENMLTRAGVKAGQTVLVTGASGGVGSAAVQLLKARDATVIAVTTPSKAQSLLDLGADVIVDRVAGPKWPSLLEVLRVGGRYAVAGAVGGPIVELDVRTLYLKDQSLFGCTVLDPGVFAALVKHIEDRRVHPLVAQTFPLREIGAAQAAFEAKAYTGKIVLLVRQAQTTGTIGEPERQDR